MVTTTYFDKDVIEDGIFKKSGIIYKTRINDVPATLNRIAEQYQQQREAIERAERVLKDFKAQAYKNEELAKMKESYDRMKKDYYRGFPISKQSRDKVQNWIKTHENEYHGGYPAYHGASGGGYQYVFAPTAIGTSQCCYCSACRAKAIKECEGKIEVYRQLLKKYDAYCNFTEDW